MKAAVISFGQRVPESLMARAVALAEGADLFLAVGTSLLVQPAASLPLVAKRAGAVLIIINRDATPLDDAAELLVNRGIGQVFSTVYPQLSQVDAQQ